MFEPLILWWRAVGAPLAQGGPLAEAGGWLVALAGVILVVLGLLDMALAVLHVQSEGLLSSRLSRVVWRALVLVSSPLGARGRDSVLAWGVPLMTGAMIGLWVLLLVCGFGLIYAPFVHQPDWFAIVIDRPPTSRLFDALYISAVSYITVGYGDLVPVHPLMRFLAVFEGASGLLTVSLAVTYLVSVFPIILHTTALAADLNQQLQGKPHALVVAQRYVSAGREDALCNRLERLSADLVSLGLAHGLYPLLYYSRPRKAQESFVRVLVGVQGLVALRYVLDPRAHRTLVADPRFEELEEALLYTLHTIEESIHFSIKVGRRRRAGRRIGREERPDEHPTEPSADVDERAGPLFGGLCAEAKRLGLVPVDQDAPQMCQQYERFRQATDPYILAYARSAALDLGSVWAPYSRHDRDTDFEAGDDEPVRIAA